MLYNGDSKRETHPTEMERTKMTFRNAQKLHNEDEVIVKKTGKILRVLNAYTVDDPMFTKCVLIECEDGNTYHHTEMK